jgi:hypothetical protein
MRTIRMYLTHIEGDQLSMCGAPEVEPKADRLGAKNQESESFPGSKQEE